MLNLVTKTLSSPLPRYPNSDEAFSILGFLVKSPLNKNCHSSATSNDINMKLRPLSQIEKRNTVISKKFDDEVISVKYDVIFIFPMYGAFAAVRKPDTRNISYLCMKHLI